jgi:hypothetical protein
MLFPCGLGEAWEVLPVLASHVRAEHLARVANALPLTPGPARGGEALEASEESTRRRPLVEGVPSRRGVLSGWCEQTAANRTDPQS